MTEDVLARLQKARKNDELVVVVRDLDGADEIEGYVVAVGEQWVLLRAIDAGSDLGDFVALRLGDVDRVRWSRSADFVRRAIQLAGQWPPVPPQPPIALNSTRAVLESAAASWPLVTIHVEDDDPDVCYIGMPTSITDDDLLLREISPAAQWDPNPRPYDLEAITRVEVGGRYEAALSAVATSYRSSEA